MVESRLDLSNPIKLDTAEQVIKYLEHLNNISTKDEAILEAAGLVVKYHVKPKDGPFRAAVINSKAFVDIIENYGYLLESSKTKEE